MLGVINTYKRGQTKRLVIEDLLTARRIPKDVRIALTLEPFNADGPKSEPEGPDYGLADLDPGAGCEPRQEQDEGQSQQSQSDAKQYRQIHPCRSKMK